MIDMKRVFLSILLASILVLTTAGYGLVRADELEDINKKLDELQKSLDSSQKATATNEQQLASLNQQLNNIKAQVTKIENDIVQKEEDIKVGEEKLAAQKELLDQRVASFYKQKGRSKDALLEILVSDSFTEFLKQFTYQQNLLDDDRKAIVRVVLLVKDIEEKKETLESEKERLIPIKQAIDEQSEFLEGEVISAKKFQEGLKSEIAALSARQQEIINARSGGFTVNIGSGAFASGGVSSRAEFIASAPGGYFAVFSFGAYTHRDGMSQYGALGRVKQGQNAEQILQYYYPGVQISKVDTNQSIIVNGTNTYGQTFNNESFQLEDYLKHIYEMPGSWPKEALKAQAIAARSYAYGKSSICPGQGCQEFKREENTEEWKAAVKETEGMIMTGGPGSFKYSSTTGGWLNNTGWDTNDGQGGSNFIEKSYETVGGSPWVYSAWYVDVFGEYGPKGGTCGRSNPWLSPEEMADIVNAHLVLTKGNSDEVSRISPITTECWNGNPYSIEELKNIASKYGGISQANSVSLTQGNGTTNTVTINGISMTGAEFKKAFSLRAPGFIRIPQKGFAFFNIEKK